MISSLNVVRSAGPTNDLPNNAPNDTSTPLPVTIPPLQSNMLFPSRNVSRYVPAARVIDADWIVALGVRPSNRRDSHIPSCCAPPNSVAALGDGRGGVGRVPEREARVRLALSSRDDTT
jgi:hypothetical protein